MKNFFDMGSLPTYRPERFRELSPSRYARIAYPPGTRYVPTDRPIHHLPETGPVEPEPIEPFDLPDTPRIPMLLDKRAVEPKPNSRSGRLLAYIEATPEHWIAADELAGMVGFEGRSNRVHGLLHRYRVVGRIVARRQVDGLGIEYRDGIAARADGYSEKNGDREVGYRIRRNSLTHRIKQVLEDGTPRTLTELVEALVAMGNVAKANKACVYNRLLKMQGRHVARQRVDGVTRYSLIEGRE